MTVPMLYGKSNKEVRLMLQEQSFKQELFSIIEQLPPDKIRVMLEIGRSIKFEVENINKEDYQPNVGTMESLESLKGIVALGGDALEDAEEYWN